MGKLFNERDLNKKDFERIDIDVRTGHVIVTDETVQLAVKRVDKLIKGVRFTTE